MKVEEVKDYLVDLYKADNADGKVTIVKISDVNKGGILLLGPPGIGKTTGVAEAGQGVAEWLKRKFVDYDDSLYKEIITDPVKYFLYVELNLNDCEPSDLTGIPKENSEGIYYKPFLWAHCLSLPGAAGFLCLDEFTNIQRLDVITASYKIVLDHRVGFTKLSNGVMVVATGNSPEESTVANLLPSPLVDRFIIYPVKQPEIEGWMAWMDGHYGDDWDKRALGYLMYFKEDFLRLPAETETLDNFPTPRSWTRISLLLPKIAQIRWQETIIGLLGPETGERFYNFLQAFVPEVEKLLKNPEIFKDLSMDAKYLASVLVGTDLRNRFEKNTEEKKRQEEIEKTLPLLQVMKDLQQDFIILTVISGGEQKIDIVLALGRKNKEIGKVLERVSIWRTKLEV